MAEVAALAVGKTRAGGALADDRDLRGIEAGIEELAAVGFDEVEVNLRADVGVAGSARGEEEQRIFVADGIGVVDLGEERGRVGELALKVETHLLADGITAGADAGADGGDEVFGARTELQAHGADAALDDAGEGAAPACVEGGDDATAGVGDENRHAVGSEDGKENIVPGGDESVAAEDGTAFGRGEGCGIRTDDTNERAMELANGDHFAGLRSRLGAGDCLEEVFAVGGDGFCGIVDVPAEVEIAGAAEDGSGAAFAGAEASAEPGISLPVSGADEARGAARLLR